jgi:hypothetical protein
MAPYARQCSEGVCATRGPGKPVKVVADKKDYSPVVTEPTGKAHAYRARRKWRAFLWGAHAFWIYALVLAGLVLLGIYLFG